MPNHKCIKLQCWFPHLPSFFSISFGDIDITKLYITHYTYMLCHSEALKYPFFFSCIFPLWFPVSGLFTGFAYVFAKSQFWCTFHLDFNCSCYDDFDSFSNCEHRFNVHTSYIDIIYVIHHTPWHRRYFQCAKRIHFAHRMRNEICEKRNINKN